MSSMTALLAAGEWTGLSKVFAQTPSPPKNGRSNDVAPSNGMEHRQIGGLDVSSIGLGCLPMVGYYGGKYDKQDMIALIRRAYDRGVTFSIRRKYTGHTPARNGWAKPSPPSGTR